MLRTLCARGASRGDSGAIAPCQAVPSAIHTASLSTEPYHWAPWPNASPLIGPQPLGSRSRSRGLPTARALSSWGDR